MELHQPSCAPGPPPQQPGLARAAGRHTQIAQSEPLRPGNCPCPPALTGLREHAHRFWDPPESTLGTTSAAPTATTGSMPACRGKGASESGCPPPWDPPGLRAPTGPRWSLLRTRATAPQQSQPVCDHRLCAAHPQGSLPQGPPWLTLWAGKPHKALLQKQQSDPRRPHGGGTHTPLTS